MAEDNRPKGRQRNVNGTASGGYRRGSGLGSGPVGNQGGYSGRPGTSQSSGGGVTRAGGGKLIGIIAAVVALLTGGGIGLGNLFGGGSSSGGIGGSASLGNLLSGFTSSVVIP